MPLAGRDEALRAVDAVLGALPGRGGALLIRGARGQGRTALLEAARARAEARGCAVLWGAGTRDGSAQPYAGLNALLRPLRGVDTFAPGHVDRFSAGVAVLDALAETAASRPLVVLIDDADGLDEASQALLAFAGRRVAGVAIALLVTAGADALRDTGLPEVTLAPLDRAAAESVVAEHALPPRLARAVVGRAEGVPVALTELARETARRAESLAAEPELALPASPRLAELFQDRLAPYGTRARTILLAAALEPEATVEEALAAANATARWTTPALSIGDLRGALAAGVVDVGGGALRLRSPLLAAAVRAAAGPAGVDAVHAAFAATLDDPHRRARHRAAITLVPDEALVAALGEAAMALRRRGALAASVTTYEAAARLAVTSADRARWLLNGASVAFELGLPAVVRRLLGLAELAGPPPALAPLLEWQRRLLVGEWPPPDDAESIRLITALVSGPDPDAALTALMPLAMGCWWSAPSAHVRAVIGESAAQLARRTADPRADAIAALADPVGAGPLVRARLAAPAADDLADPLDAVYLAIAAQAVGAWRESYRLLGPAIERLRRQGHDGALAHALIHQAHAAYYTGDWALAATLGEEASRIATRASRPRHAFAGQLVNARAAALTGAGTLDEVEARTARIGLPGGDAMVRSARAALALAHGDPERAAAALLPLFATPTREPQAMVRASWEIFDLVEALVLLRRREDAAARLGDYETHALRHPGGAAEAAIVCARALVADAPAAFTTALEHDLSAWPFLRARTLLAAGGVLHRARRGTEAADALRAARDELLMLGAAPFVERAQRELRAAGEAPVAVAAALAELTPHELRIARLAADGLSNPEIGARLAVSPRTIASHLYRVFPKLGITSRAQLRQVLSEA